MALTCAPQSAFACVHSTPFGRDVVPDVYCTPIGRAGSGGRLGARSASPSSPAKPSSAAGAFLAATGVPLS
jgi:hypothetical protein